MTTKILSDKTVAEALDLSETFVALSEVQKTKLRQKVLEVAGKVMIGFKFGPIAAEFAPSASYTVTWYEYNTFEEGTPAQQDAEVERNKAKVRDFVTPEFDEFFVGLKEPLEYESVLDGFMALFSNLYGTAESLAIEESDSEQDEPLGTKRKFKPKVVKSPTKRAKKQA